MSKRRDWGSGSIVQRSKGHWQVSVELGRDPVTGKRERLRFTVTGTKRDALKALNGVIVSITAESFRTGPRPPSGWKEFIAGRVTDKSSITAAQVDHEPLG